MQTYHTALLPLTWCKSCLHLGYFWACCLTVYISHTHTQKKSQQSFCLQFCWHLLKHSSFLTHISSRSIWFIFYLFILILVLLTPEGCSSHMLSLKACLPLLKNESFVQLWALFPGSPSILCLLPFFLLLCIF